MTMSCEAFFTKLGEAIRADWERVGFDERGLPEIAERHLHATPPAEHVTLEQIVEYALHQRRRTVIEAKEDFGQPNINVYVDQRFYIEVLFWLEGTTSIHQHRFSGAFHVMSGGSVHSSYEFEETWRGNSRFKTGRLHQKQTEVLRRGDVRRIVSGQALVHSLFHLDHPSITVVVRTPTDPDIAIQYSYLYPGLAVAPFEEQHHTLATRALRLLHELEHPDFDRQTERYLAQCDAFNAFDVFRRFVGPRGLAWVKRMAGALSGTSYAPALPTMVAALQEDQRLRQIVALRGEVKSRDLRLTLGVLLNCRTLEAMSKLMAGAFPGRGGREVLLESIAELTRAGVGFPPDDSTLELVDLVLEGLTDAEIMGRLAAEYSDESIAEMKGALVEACALLRDHYLISPLVADATAQRGR